LQVCRVTSSLSRAIRTGRPVWWARTAALHPISMGESSFAPETAAHMDLPYPHAIHGNAQDRRKIAANGKRGLHGAFNQHGAVGQRYGEGNIRLHIGMFQERYL
jgi:hypothetical protein